MKLKLLSLVGLCALLVVMWNQPVRAGCTYGLWQFQVTSNYWAWTQDSGCVFDGTVGDTDFHCTSYIIDRCASGYVYYNCGCS
jgi:hypothetical protein